MKPETPGHDASVPLPSGLAIGILTRNHERYIAEAIESVARQTWPPSALLILDNGSSDSTSLEISRSLAYWGLSDTQLIHSATNLNASGGLRALLQQARKSHEYMIVLHGDDILDQEFVEHVHRELLLIRRPTVLQANLKPFGARQSSPARIPFRWSGVRRLDRLAIRFGNCGTMPGAVIPVEVALDSGGLGDPEETCCAEDWILWQRLALAGVGFSTMSDALVNYRRHLGDSSQDSRQARAVGLGRGIAIAESTTRSQRCAALLGAAVDCHYGVADYEAGMAATGISSEDVRWVAILRRSAFLRLLVGACFRVLRVTLQLGSRLGWSTRAVK